MNAITGISAVQAHNWQSLSSSSDKGRLTIREINGYFKHTSRNEDIVRFLGIVMVLGGFIQWVGPNTDLVGDPTMTKVGLSVAFSIIGMALYSFATRGHRNEIMLHPVRKELRIANLNRQDRTKSEKKVALSDVISIYVRRPETPLAPASLQIRLRSSTTEICALRGKLLDIESLHRQLCHEIRQIG